jgi:hypothetical protein
VPLRVAVPSPLLVKPTPVGSVPVNESVAGGTPVVVTVNVPRTPTANAALFALVIATPWWTVSVKACVAFVPTPLAAVIVSGYVPPVAAPGVPASVAVPLPLFVNVTPAGKHAALESVALGNPVVVNVKVPAVPTVKIVALTLVMAGAWLTVSVKACVAVAPTPLLALIVIGLRAAGERARRAGERGRTVVVVGEAHPRGQGTRLADAHRRPRRATPVVVTTKLPAVPTVNVAALALVIAAAWLTMSVKACVALGVTPFCAVT